MNNMIIAFLTGYIVLKNILDHGGKLTDIAFQIFEQDGWVHAKILIDGDKVKDKLLIDSCGGIGGGVNCLILMD